MRPIIRAMRKNGGQKMPRGGHASSGPAPDPNSLRSSDGWSVLPGEGYRGELPEWPLYSFHPRELVIWADLWRKPQAVMWAALGMTYEVALFVRNLAAAEAPGSTAADQVVVLRYFDSLGLTVAGLARHRWRIGAAADEYRPETRTAAAEQAPRKSARSRLTVVQAPRE